MNTAFLLMARYDALAVIPIETVRRDFFSHLAPEMFLRKANAGEIDLPVVRIEGSAKTMKGVHLTDLAAYIDRRREAALDEWEQRRARRDGAA